MTGLQLKKRHLSRTSIQTEFKREWSDVLCVHIEMGARPSTARIMSDQKTSRNVIV